MTQAKVLTLLSEAKKLNESQAPKADNKFNKEQ
ncbi:hypothetical protein IS91_2802, partial [Staphylococcus aureus subsp. aureus IS-91]